MSPRYKAQPTVEYALLGFLQWGPLHGYELHQRLQAAQQLGLVWRVKQARLYALLAKLEADGLVAAELRAQAARPPKRLLHLTNSGRDQFAQWLASPVAHGRDVRIEFLAKLFWAQQSGPEASHALIMLQRVVTQQLLAEVEAELQSTEDATPYARLVHEFRWGQLDAMLRWLDTCEAFLARVPA